MKLTILIHNRMYKNKTRILFIVALTLFVYPAMPSNSGYVLQGIM